MRPFAAIFVPDDVEDALSDRAWLRAMLDAERALALAGARAGLVPADSGDAIAAHCDAASFDVAHLAVLGRGPGNPVEPLVRKTLAAAGTNGMELLRLFAAELELPEPTVPWHTVRTPFVDLDGALASTAVAAGKIATDVILLAQTEAGELAERDGGASSTMPHEHNTVGAVLAAETLSEASRPEEYLGSVDAFIDRALALHAR